MHRQAAGKVIVAGQGGAAASGIVSEIDHLGRDAGARLGDGCELVAWVMAVAGEAIGVVGKIRAIANLAIGVGVAPSGVPSLRTPPLTADSLAPRMRHAKLVAQVD